MGLPSILQTLGETFPGLNQTGEGFLLTFVIYSNHRPPLAVKWKETHYVNISVSQHCVNISVSQPVCTSLRRGMCTQVDWQKNTRHTATTTQHLQETIWDNMSNTKLKFFRLLSESDRFQQNFDFAGGGGGRKRSEWWQIRSFGSAICMRLGGAL